MIDLLGTALSSLRIAGTTLLHEEYSPPWSVAVPSSHELARVLGLGKSSQAVAFHLVRKGAFTLRVSAHELHRVSAGEMAIVFGGAAHTMSDGRAVAPCPVERLIGTYRPDRAGRRSSPNGTRLVCGVFSVANAELHPLFASLPPVLLARPSGEGGSWQSNQVAELLVRELDRREPGGPYAISRLVELLCLEALRLHVSTSESMIPGFLRGLTDSATSRAMRAIMERPGVAISVATLARSAGLSPSRFAARFREAVGQSPIEFATRWRMDLAARWLVETDWSVGEIADRVGYESPAAFSRAFSRLAGQSPKSWRSSRRGVEPEQQRDARVPRGRKEQRAGG